MGSGVHASAKLLGLRRGSVSRHRRFATRTKLARPAGIIEPLEDRLLLDALAFTHADYPVAGWPDAMAVADFNGDGKLDLATANYNKTLSVLLNNGSGGFAASINFPVGSHPTGVWAADLDHNGTMDLVTMNGYDGTVSVLLGNGDGGFAAKTDYPTGFYSWEIVLADFNEDGCVDLAFHSGPATLGILWGDGTGGFGSRTDLVTGGCQDPRATADFNGDGHADLLGWTSETAMGVLLGDGKGDFTPGPDLPVIGEDASVVAADFNGDGILDLAIASSYSWQVGVFLGDGSGGFLDRGSFGSISAEDSPLPQMLAAADFDGDGNIDLAVANGWRSTVSLLSGDGTGGFGQQIDLPVGYTLAVAAADFDGDGEIELAAGSEAGVSDYVRLYLNMVGHNLPPTAKAGNPYKIGFGQALTLNASASSDPENDPLTYGWDLNGDGDFSDASGVKPTLSWAQLQALGLGEPGIYSGIRVQVDDGQGAVVVSGPTQLTVLLAGDTDSNGKVTYYDYRWFECYYHMTGQTWNTGDFDGDGTVTFRDYILLETNFGKTIGPRTATPPASAPLLAEPVVATSEAVLVGSSMLAQPAPQVLSHLAGPIAPPGWQRPALATVSGMLGLEVFRKLAPNLIHDLLAADRLI